MRKSLYGIKHASCAWHQRFIELVSTLGFSYSVCDHSLFIYHSSNDAAYILLYVEAIILSNSSDTLLRSIMSKLNYEFAIKYLGPLSNFHDISVTRH